MNTLLLAFATPLLRSGIAVNFHGLGVQEVAPISEGLPLRVMPLGASITYGYRSSDGNGYRDGLRASLAEAGNPVHMVGSRAHGSMADNLVEGWPGFVIAQVHRKAQAAVPRWLPNVVLVNAGTNDCVARNTNGSVAGAADRMEAMLADVWSMSPRAVVVLSSLVPNADAAVEANVRRVNRDFAALVDDLRAAGRPLVFADMHSPRGPLVEDLVDGTHPNDVGYQKMADLWFEAIVQADNEGLLQRPEPLPGVPDDGGFM